MDVHRLVSAVIVWFVAGTALASGSVESNRPAEARTGHSQCLAPLVSASRLGLNLDLRDFGRLFLDAGRPECAVSAAAALTAKLDAMLDEAEHRDEYGRLVGPFQGWLEGAQVALVFSAALQLGGRNELDAELDEQLKRLRAKYRFAIDPFCGPNFGNGCMDDHAVAANAFAWIAAYEAMSGREATAVSAAAQSRDALDDALSSRNHVCKVRHEMSMPAPCVAFEGAADGLASGYLEIVSFSHGFQNVAYGIGLLSSLSGAALALELAEEPWAPSSENRIVADALFVEGQRATLPDGSDFRADCYRVENGVLFSDSPCADALNKLPPDDPRYDPNLYYLPRMMPVLVFFERLLDGAPNADPYRFDELDAGLFNNSFLNEGRLATSGHLGYYWWNPAGSPVLRPALGGFARAARTRPARR